MSVVSWEAYDRINTAMKSLKEATEYLPHRFGSIHRAHDQAARDIAVVCTNLSQFHEMYDGDPSQVKKLLKEIKRNQRARLTKVRTW